MSDTRQFCLPDDALAMLTKSAKEHPALMEHVTGCDRCAERLRVLLEVETTDLTQEEERLLESVERRRAVTEQSSSEPRKLRFPWAKPLAAAALVLVAMTISVWLFYNQPQRRVDRLIAEAYSASRPFDWRLPDAGFSPTAVRRAASESVPASLEEAGALLARNSDTAGAASLNAAGRVDLLNSRINDGLTKLEKSVQLEGSNPVFRADLAVAFALRGVRDNRPSDYQTAVEHCTQALRLNPRFGRALFNRALAHEKLHQPAEAIADWNAFLQLEQDEGWRREAREHLQSSGSNGTPHNSDGK